MLRSSQKQLTLLSLLAGVELAVYTFEADTRGIVLHASAEDRRGGGKAAGVGVGGSGGDGDGDSDGADDDDDDEGEGEGGGGDGVGDSASGDEVSAHW